MEREGGKFVLRGSSSARRSFRLHCRNSHQVVGKHGSTYQYLKALAPFRKTTRHATTAEQHGDAPLDAGSKALSFLESRTLLISFALRRFLPATLRCLGSA